MDNVLGVRRLHSPAYLDRNADRLFIGKLSLFLYISLERHALNILHDNVVNAGLTAYIINIDNIGML